MLDGESISLATIIGNIFPSAVRVGEFVDEAGLPHAGFPHDGDELAAPVLREGEPRRICSISASRPTNRVSPRALPG